MFALTNLALGVALFFYGDAVTLTILCQSTYPYVCKMSMMFRREHSEKCETGTPEGITIRFIVQMLTGVENIWPKPYIVYTKRRLPSSSGVYGCVLKMLKHRLQMDGCWKLK